MDIENWLNNVTEKLNESFSDNLLFIGLQGSYNRGEATETSDIDLVVILDNMSFDDLKQYKSIINNMPDKDKACGFISGKAELQKWSKSDLFQFFYDTKSLFGKLENIIQPPPISDIKKSIKIGAENIFHAAVHSFVHSNNYIEDLKSLYKMTFFILQAKNFVKTGKNIQTKKKLIKVLTGEDKEILTECINKENISDKDCENLYNKLIKWSSENI